MYPSKRSSALNEEEFLGGADETNREKGRENKGERKTEQGIRELVARA